jgi:hypothetical protein
MDQLGDVEGARSDVDAARREAAAAAARLAAACVRFADLRISADLRAMDRAGGGAGRVRPGEFVADEVSLLVREQAYQVRCLIARSRRLAADLPTVWDAFLAGEVDADQIRVIDRVARRVVETHTLTAIDDRVVEAAQTRCPKRLATWLLRLVVQLEPAAFAQRHRKALAERRVTVVQGADGIGYVTGEVSAADAAAIDAMLAATARSLGAEDPRTEQQRRADCFADVLLGRLGYDQADVTTADSDPDHDSSLADDEPADDQRAEGEPAVDAAGPATSWLEVEDIDYDTGELLGTHWQRVDADGEPVDWPDDGTSPFRLPAQRRPGRRLRIGIVVPLTSLLNIDDTPGELADRSALISAEGLRQLIADTLGPDPSGRDEVLFTRLLTDSGGRLLETTELRRYPSRRLAEAIMIRAGTCRFPTCNVPAERCDLDHHQPWPHGPTSAANLDPLCRRHHRGKTFAWQASLRDHDGVDWTMPDAHHYRCKDEPFQTGLTRAFTE